MKINTITIICVIISLGLIKQITEAKPWEFKEDRVRSSKQGKKCNHWELSHGAVECLKQTQGGSASLTGQCRMLDSINNCFEDLYDGCTDKNLELMGLLGHWQKFQKAVDRHCGI